MTEEDKNLDKTKVTDTDGNPSEDTVSMSKEEFDAFQKQMVDMKEQLDTSEKEKIEIEKTGLFKELTRLNPKLAELNKTAEISTLKVVLKTAEAIGNNFIKFEETKVEKKAEGNAGYRLMGSDEWLYK